MRTTPSLRIGDVERDAAIAALSRHFGDGRLTQAEHEERMALALKAKYGSDLDALFADLPRLDDAVVAKQPSRGSGGAQAMQVFVSAAMIIAGIFLMTHILPIGLFILVVLFSSRLAYGSRRRQRQRQRVAAGPWPNGPRGWSPGPGGRGGWPPGPGSYGRRW